MILGSVSMCSARGSASTKTVSAYPTITQIPVDTWITNTDADAFSLESNGIKCNYDGVVMVSGAVYCYESTNTETKGAYIFMDGVEKQGGWGYRSNAAGCTTGMQVFEIEAGTVFTLACRTYKAGTASPNNGATHLDIMYLEAYDG